MQGWVKVHRSLVKWEWYDDPTTFRVFLHLLLTANWDDRSWRGVLVKRGQRCTGIRALAKEIGITVQALRTALGKLRSTHEITQSATHKYTVITVCNYEKYQDVETDNNTASNTQTTQKQHSNNTVATHKQHDHKNNNNYKNNKKGDLPTPKRRKTTFKPESISKDVYTKCLNDPDMAAGDKAWLKRQVKSMADYFKAKGEMKVDWAATLRNWLRNSRAKYGDQPAARTNGTHESKAVRTTPVSPYMNFSFDEKGRLIAAKVEDVS